MDSRSQFSLLAEPMATHPPPPPLPDFPHRCSQGHVEAGENMVQTALRELTEETGLVTAGGAITVCAIGILFVSCVVKGLTPRLCAYEGSRPGGPGQLSLCHPVTSNQPLSWPAPSTAHVPEQIATEAPIQVQRYMITQSDGRRAHKTVHFFLARTSASSSDAVEFGHREADTVEVCAAACSVCHYVRTGSHGVAGGGVFDVVACSTQVTSFCSL